MHPHTLTYPNQASLTQDKILLILPLPQSQSTQKKTASTTHDTPTLTYTPSTPGRWRSTTHSLHLHNTPLVYTLQSRSEYIWLFVLSTCYFLSVFLVSCGVVISVSKSPVSQSRIY
ncbi:hypothetical protein BJX65DRAFT_272629 [Aspergillus insuetus]